MTAKKCRTELFKNTIIGYTEPTVKLKFTSAKAQRITKSLFEKLVMNLEPWESVCKPGTLRHYEISIPEYEVPSREYFKNMLVPTFERVKKALEDKDRRA